MVHVLLFIVNFLFGLVKNLVFIGDQFFVAFNLSCHELKTSFKCVDIGTKHKFFLHGFSLPFLLVLFQFMLMLFILSFKVSIKFDQLVLELLYLHALLISFGFRLS